MRAIAPISFYIDPFLNWWWLHTLWPKENISNKDFLCYVLLNSHFSSNEIAHMWPSMPTMDTQIR